MNQQKVKHLIFDLGGVIINLQTSRTINAFAKLTDKPTEFILDFSSSHPAFHQYEKGQIDSAAFREVIRSISAQPLTDTAIDIAWNDMILDLPIERIDLLKKLGNIYDTYLLSNTNVIHLQRVEEVLADSGIEPFKNLFVKEYYSHLMGKRKPDAEIFEQVLDENGILAEDTLFLDDNLDNIKGASKLGLKTLHVTSPQLIFDFFNGR